MGRGGSLKVYAEMMRILDEGVGRVMKTLRAAGLDRNTLVIFTSDNGGERFSYQWPFSGDKGDLLEGGIRVPAIVRWPGTVPANRVTHQMAITMDWTATILAAAGAKAADGYPLDGIDLLPAIEERSRRMTAHSSGASTIRTLCVKGSGSTFATESAGNCSTCRSTNTSRLILVRHILTCCGVLRLSLISGTGRCCRVFLPEHNEQIFSPHDTSL